MKINYLQKIIVFLTINIMNSMLIQKASNLHLSKSDLPLLKMFGKVNLLRTKVPK